jgi:8-oxo-dGTP diphosphatase
VSGLIEVVTAVIRDAEGRMLVVRKRGTTSFMKPGGKREAGEDDLSALRRELLEELGCGFEPASARLLGCFEAAAANEPDTRVRAATYVVTPVGAIAPSGEIEEIAWIDPARPTGLALAPLLRDEVLPALLRS